MRLSVNNYSVELNRAINLSTYNEKRIYLMIIANKGNLNQIAVTLNTVDETTLNKSLTGALFLDGGDYIEFEKGAINPISAAVSATKNAFNFDINDTCLITLIEGFEN